MLLLLLADLAHNYIEHNSLPNTAQFAQPLEASAHVGTLQQRAFNEGRIPCNTPKPTLKVGIVGGSISWGAELPHLLFSRYSAQLQKRLSSRLPTVMHNRAMPSTGIGFASFCIDTIMPEDVQVLVVEYNFNDAYGADKIDLGDGTVQSPSSSMERLIRSMLLRQPPPWLIVVLVVCRGWSACETIHSRVAGHYSAQGVTSISLRVDGVDSPDIPFYNRSHHPTLAGHTECARLLEAAIIKRRAELMLATCPTTTTYPLPTPLHEPGPWERATARWSCKTCLYRTCPDLQPLVTDGFELRGSAEKISAATAKAFCSIQRPLLTCHLPMARLS